MLQPQWNTPAGTIGSYSSGAAVNFLMTAVSTSGSFNMRYYIQSGSLAPGLTLDSYTGRITGTLGVYKVDTTWTFTVRAIDGGGNLRDRTFTITAQKDVPPNFVTPTGPLIATINDTTWLYTNVPYTTSLSDPSITMTVVSGSLPPGLSLSSTGVLQGYASPVQLSSIYTFTLKISNSIGSNTRVYTITVNPAVPRLPTILNSQPLTPTIPANDPLYGYYRSSNITQFTGAISTTPIPSPVPPTPAMEGVVGCTVGAGSGSYTSAGNTLTIGRIDGWVLPGTEILQQLTGAPGGIGTYRVDANQTVSSYNLYAINSSSGFHTTFTGSIAGSILTVTALITGTVSIGQKLYTPTGIFVGDIVTDGVNTATITEIPGGPTLPGMYPYGVIPWQTQGTYTLDQAVTFTGPIQVTSNKLVVNHINWSVDLIRGDGIIGGLLPADTYIADQVEGGINGGIGVYILDTYTQSPYAALSATRNVLTVTAITRGTIELNRVVQTPVGAGVLNNTIIVDQITPLLAGEVLGGIGRYTVSRAQTVAPTTLVLDVDIGTYYYDDYFAYKIIGYDWSGAAIASYNYTVTTLPPGLTLDTATGWITGTPQGVGSTRYNFTATVTNAATLTSTQVTFSVVFSSVYANAITWLTPSQLGTITNYHISNFSVSANADQLFGTIKYRIINGALPPTMQLTETGLIIGRAAFVPTNYQIQPNTTVPFTFTVQAYTLNYPSIVSSNRTFTINVFVKYATPIETVYLKCTPPIKDRNMLIGRSDSLFGTTQRVITTVISVDATANTLRCTSTAPLSVGSPVQFSGTVFGGVSSGVTYWVISKPGTDTIKISTVLGGTELNLTTSTGLMSVTSTLIPQELLYRAEDPYYGLNEQIRIDHIYGVNANELPAYTTAVQKNHYKRRFTLGPLSTAVARDSNNNIIYEVVYCNVIDNLINNNGVSINYAIEWPINIPIDQTVVAYYSSLGDIYASWEYIADKDYYTSLVWAYRKILYPNSLPNMRTNLIEQLGSQMDTSLMPLWMTSQQNTGGTTGYIPAWVICYTKPGCSSIVLNAIQQSWPYTMNLIDFEVDRVLVDKSITFNYNTDTASWISLPSGQLQSGTLISVEAPNVIIVGGNTSGWHVDMAFSVSSSTGAAIGGLDVSVVYYIKTIDYSVTPPRFTISKSLYGATEILVTSGLAPGQVITITPVNPGPQPIDSDDYAILYNKTTIVYP